MRKDAVGWESLKEVLVLYSLGACTSCHTSIYISDTLICSEKGVCETLIGPTYGLHRVVVICSLCHSKCTWLFRTIRISLHRQNPADLRLGRPCFTSTLLRIPEGSSSLSRWGLVQRLLTFLLYPGRCRHHRHSGRSYSPTQPSPNVRHGSMSAQLYMCLARWM